LFYLPYTEENEPYKSHEILDLCTCGLEPSYFGFRRSSSCKERCRRHSKLQLDIFDIIDNYLICIRRHAPQSAHSSLFGMARMVMTLLLRSTREMSRPVLRSLSDRSFPSGTVKMETTPLLRAPRSARGVSRPVPLFLLARLFLFGMGKMVMRRATRKGPWS